MAFKINIGDNGKTWKLEAEAESLLGKNIGDKVDGKEIKADLQGWEFEIAGGSDSSGFPLSNNVEGLGLKRVLLKKGWGMRQNKPEGLRLRKTVRGRQISSAISQLNLKILRQGNKKLEEIFTDQNMPKESKTEAKPAEKKAENPAA